jgi:hypothetical protein
VAALLPLPTVYAPTTSSRSLTPNAWVIDAPGTASVMNRRRGILGRRQVGGQLVHGGQQPMLPGRGEHLLA